MMLCMYLLQKGFIQSVTDPCIFYNRNKKGLVILAVYVDNCCIADKERLGWTKDVLQQGFKMKDLGEARSLLGMQLIRDRERKTLKLLQGGMVDKVLAAAEMGDCKSVTTPMDPKLQLERNVDRPEAMARYPYRKIVVL